MARDQFWDPEVERLPRSRLEAMQVERLRWQLVMIRNGAVRTEYNRLSLGGQVRPANRSFHPLDTHFGSVYNVSHCGPPDHRSYPTMLWRAMHRAECSGYRGIERESGLTSNLLHDRAYGRLHRS